MSRFVQIFAALFLLISVISAPGFSIPDHCEKSEIHLHSAQKSSMPSDHDCGCPQHHHCSVQLVSLLQKETLGLMDWSEPASLSGERLMSIKTAPDLDGPFQPPRA